MVRARILLDDYPMPMSLHLDTNYLLYRWKKRGLGEGLKANKVGCKKERMLVTAFEGAGAAVGM